MLRDATTRAKGLERYDRSRSERFSPRTPPASRLTATIEETYDRIESHNDPALFIAIRPRSEALAIAERVQASGPEGKPLYGVPFVVKDNIDVAGFPTTAACPAFAYQPREIGVRRGAA